MHPFERSFKQPEKVPKVLLHSGLSLCLWPGRQPPLVRITTQVPREMDIHYTRQDASRFPDGWRGKSVFRTSPHLISIGNFPVGPLPWSELHIPRCEPESKGILTRHYVLLSLQDAPSPDIRAVSQFETGTQPTTPKKCKKSAR